MPLDKLENYVLNNDHPRGMHKARVFRDKLGIERRHGRVLAELIQRSLSRAPAEQSKTNAYGEFWTTQHEIIGLNGQSAIVTVVWIFKSDASQIPVLISCYIELRNQDKLRELFAVR